MKKIKLWNPTLIVTCFCVLGDLSFMANTAPHSEKTSPEQNIVVNQRLKTAKIRNCQNANIENDEDTQSAFETIYDQNSWNSSESKSGTGSEMQSTQNIRAKLPEIWGKYNIKSILDVPCGDYNWMKTVEKKGVTYIGGDIVPKMIGENNKNFKDANVSFEVIDITADNIPKVDMIFCKDCLQHLSHENVKKALKNFKRSGSTYLLVTSYPWTLENWDISDGSYCPLNLTIEPFNITQNYLEKIHESNIEASGNEPDKTMYLYKLDDILNDMNTDSTSNKSTWVSSNFWYILSITLVLALILAILIRQCPTKI